MYYMYTYFKFSYNFFKNLVSPHFFFFFFWKFDKYCQYLDTNIFFQIHWSVKKINKFGLRKSLVLTFRSFFCKIGNCKKYVLATSEVTVGWILCVVHEWRVNLRHVPALFLVYSAPKWIIFFCVFFLVFMYLGPSFYRRYKFRVFHTKKFPTFRL